MKPYRLQRLELPCVDALRAFFDDLPLDPYLAQPYRSRRFSKFRVFAESLVRLDHQYFVQAREYNPLLGEVRRHYTELDENLTAIEGFRLLIFDFLKICDIWPREVEVGVHQIKITSTWQMLGCPAPEGMHQDGFDYIGICCVSRDNILGGETALYESGKVEPVYRRTLEPGELLVFDDKQLFHYTSSIEVVNADDGVRDVFILTASVTRLDEVAGVGETASTRMNDACGTTYQEVNDEDGRGERLV